MDAREEEFDFFDFTIKVVKSLRVSKSFQLTRPSKEALKSIRGEIKEMINRSSLHLPRELTIRKFNEVVRGWGLMIILSIVPSVYGLIYYLTERIRIYLRRKHIGREGGSKWSTQTPSLMMCWGYMRYFFAYRGQAL